MANNRKTVRSRSREDMATLSVKGPHSLARTDMNLSAHQTTPHVIVAS